MSKSVTLTIDGQTVVVPEGTLIVDAAKKAGIDIPVFCYHPKMEPVGMCRMCLVDIGRPMVDRASGQVLREADGSPKMQFSPKLETACTTPVSEGMVVIGQSDKVQAARKEVVEFLLTSHPLDCPICDKGGECPLQNLTMAYGPGQSRYLLDDKMRLAKHYPLGELIYLDRERCIQCARCVRFQDEIVGDPVIGFYNRGRRLEIVTHSEPGFDSVFSGNTTDICPVGALTTADFRFEARPWELKAAASICSQCPVGCNITYNVRREAASGGRIVLKRAMPRQNEAVNEIWMCDKGRFAYHYTESKERLTAPLVRRDGQLVPVPWEEALQRAAEGLRAAGEGVLTLGSGRLANEDLFNLGAFTRALKGRTALYTSMGGGELTTRSGVAPGTNLGALGPGSAILVVACDLEQEAPIWYLRLKQAAGRGATLIVASARPTKLDRYAAHVIRYPYGSEAEAVRSLGKEGSGEPGDLGAIGAAFAAAENALIFYGSDGLGLAGSQSLAQACADLLETTHHTGRPNNGLVGVWPRANDQGAWELGWQPLPDLKGALEAAPAAYIVAADPFGDDATLKPPANARRPFLVVQDLFLTETARQADVVLPAQPYTEREGTYTSGERRVQRFYPAVPPRPDCQPDFTITARLAELAGLSLEGRLAAALFNQLATQAPVYAGLNYRTLAEVQEQWPVLGYGNLYYGGTAYRNTQGLGAQLALSSVAPSLPAAPLAAPKKGNGLLAVPITRLYDRGQTVLPSAELLRSRIAGPFVALNPAEAASLGLAAPSGGQPPRATLALEDGEYAVSALLDENVPSGVVLVPRSFGIPLFEPAAVVLRPVGETVPA